MLCTGFALYCCWHAASYTEHVYIAVALSGSPKLVIFRFDQDKQGWIDDRSHRAVAPKIKPQVAAIVSLP